MRNSSVRGDLFDLSPFCKNGNLHPVYSTSLGSLFQGDCSEVLRALRDNCIDTVFADPPFNIGKKYGNKVNDSRKVDDYLQWCHSWVDECLRILKDGGAFFLYNIPKWNIRLANYLIEKKMEFRHWIVINIKFGLPIPNRLYPSHYSLLYFTKGRHKTFRKIRTPIKACRHCGMDVNDYGGHRNAMNPNGVNLSDVWNDIPPVRHPKFKSRKRKANALSTKLLERVVEMSTEPGDLVLDPFGGSGTTFAVCEKKKRRWIGIEIQSPKVIVERLQGDNILYHRNSDFVEII